MKAHGENPENIENIAPNEDASHYEEGIQLARSRLGLSGSEAKSWALQYSDFCCKKVSAIIHGDDSHFKSAFVFPIACAPNGDDLHTIGQDGLHALVHLTSGHLCFLKLPERTFTSERLVKLFELTGRILDQNLGLSTQPAQLERRISTAVARRIRVFDLKLAEHNPQSICDCMPSAIDELGAMLFNGFGGLSHLGKKEARKSFCGAIAGQFTQTLKLFTDTLNTSVIQALLDGGLSPTVLGYNQFLANNTPSLAYRIQAAAVLPIATGIMASNDQIGRSLRASIDVTKPLWPALSHALGAPEETVRWLRGKSIADIGKSWADRLPELVKLLAYLPPSHRPANRADWDALTDFAPVFNGTNNEKKKAYWIRELGKMGWAKARQRFEQHRAAPSELLNLVDFINSISSALIFTLLSHYTKSEIESTSPTHFDPLHEIVEAAFHNASIMKQVTSSVRWHENQIKAESVMDANENELLTWSTPFLTPQKICHGIYAYFLRNRDQLIAEGKAMSHCVGYGSYTKDCHQGRTFIISIQKEDGTRLSTAQLNLYHNGKEPLFDLVQHRTKSNEEPPADICAALIAYVEKLNSMEYMELRLELQSTRENIEKNVIHQRMWEAHSHWTEEQLSMLKDALKAHSGWDRFYSEVTEKYEIFVP